MSRKRTGHPDYISESAASSKASVSRPGARVAGEQLGLFSLDAAATVEDADGAAGDIPQPLPCAGEAPSSPVDVTVNLSNVRQDYQPPDSNTGVLKPVYGLLEDYIAGRY